MTEHPPTGDPSSWPPPSWPPPSWPPSGPGHVRPGHAAQPGYGGPPGDGGPPGYEGPPGYVGPPGYEGPRGYEGLPRYPPPPGQAGQPGQGGQPGYPPSGGVPTTSPSRSTTVTLARVAQGLVPPLVLVGLALPLDSSAPFASNTLWAVFALLAAGVQLTPLGGGLLHREPETTWVVGAAAVCALLLYWVLIALPAVGSNSGFLVTVSTALAVFGLWQSPGRRW